MTFKKTKEVIEWLINAQSVKIPVLYWRKEILFDMRVVEDIVSRLALKTVRFVIFPFFRTPEVTAPTMKVCLLPLFLRLEIIFKTFLKNDFSYLFFEIYM